MMFWMTDHSECRAAQRRLNPEEVEYVMLFGTCFYCNGARVYYLRQKDLPPGDPRAWAYLVGAAVVTSLDRQTIITVWRNRRSGLKFLRRRAARKGGRRQSAQCAVDWEQLDAL